MRADLDGLAEVDHPGGVCWNTETPDVRPGGVVAATDDVAADASPSRCRTRRSSA